MRTNWLGDRLGAKEAASPSGRIVDSRHSNDRTVRGRSNFDWTKCRCRSDLLQKVIGYKISVGRNVNGLHSRNRSIVCGSAFAGRDANGDRKAVRVYNSQSRLKTPSGRGFQQQIASATTHADFDTRVVGLLIDLSCKCLDL